MGSEVKKKVTAEKFLFMILAFAIYSATGIFSKYAALYPFLSVRYIACFAGVIFLLGIYAVMWQYILKWLPLTVAFMWKSTGLIFGLLYSHLFFHEIITVNNILGIAIILAGVLIISHEQ